MSAVVFDFHDKLVVVHAVLACVAVLAFMPAALLVQRLAKIKQTQSRLHVPLNLVTGLLVTIAFALGTIAVASQAQGYQFSGPNRDLHHDLGLALLLLVALQIALGLASTRVRLQAFTRQVLFGRNLLRWVHVLLGVSVSLLLIVQCWNGFDEWNTMQSTGTLTPDGVRYVFIVVVGIEVAAYAYLASRSTLVGIEKSGVWSQYVDDKYVLDGARD